MIEAAQKVCWNQKHFLGIQTTASEAPVLEPSAQTAIAAGVAATLEVVEGRKWVQQGTSFAPTGILPVSAIARAWGTRHGCIGSL